MRNLLIGASLPSVNQSLYSVLRDERLHWLSRCVAFFMKVMSAVYRCYFVEITRG